MMLTKTDTSTLEIRRTVKAPVDRVFKAWTEPDQITKWFGCKETGKVELNQDFRVGGEYSHTCTYPTGTTTMFGTFLEIERNRKIVYSWSNSSAEYPAKDTLVTVEFIEKGSETEIVLKHSKFAKPISVQGHTMGWEAALDKFVTLFS